MSKLSSKIPDEKSWIRREYAQDEHGYSSRFDYHGACKFCLSGAIQSFGYAAGSPEYMRLVKIIEDYTKENSKYHGNASRLVKDDGNWWSIPDFNDSHLTTWEDVKEVIHRFDTQSS